MAEPFTYPSGFRVGEVLRVLPGPRKYNRIVRISPVEDVIVVDPPNVDGWPDDAVQIRTVPANGLLGGEGAVDAGMLVREVDRNSCVAACRAVVAAADKAGALVACSPELTAAVELCRKALTDDPT